MPEPKISSTQTWIVLSAAIAAVVGAVVGATVAMVMSGTFGFKTSFSTVDNALSEEVMESRIIELIEEESATIAVVERVTPAVVSIVVKQERGSLSSADGYRYFSPFFQTEELSAEESAELVEVSGGTGFFVTEDGFVLTNRHVVDEEHASFFVVTAQDVELEAELIDIDPYQDIAVLKVEGDGFATMTLADSDAIRIGQTVIAIGNTLSEFRNTVTKGVVSGINRRVTAGSAASSEVIEEAIQTDAAINPGNSGGPLINLLGEVIGINTAVSIEGEAVAFAIPINAARRSIDDVQEFGRIMRPWLGVRYVLVVPDGSEDENIDYEIGAMVVRGDVAGEVAVFEDSPADIAEITEGDVIVSVEGVYLTLEDPLAEALSMYHPGDSITLELLRDGVLISKTVTLAEYGA
jgi:S1-C subfamily serine protease